MKKSWNLFYCFLLFWLSIAFSIANATQPAHHDRVTVPVKVSVANKDWVTTITICNNTSQTLPLTDIELNFNYNTTMPNDIWGSPWAAWHVSSQQGQAVVLLGGTPWTPPLQPDPNCTNPMTVMFGAAPTLPLPTGPFIFKAANVTPPQTGNLIVTLSSAPASGLSNPELTVTGMGTTNKKIVNWGTQWTLNNLSAGSYTVTGASISNGTDQYQASPVTVTVASNQTAQAAVTYTRAVPSTGSLNISMPSAPASGLKNPTVTVNGTNTNLQKIVNWGTQWSLSNLTAGSYTINSEPVDNGTQFFKADPLNVTVQNGTTAQAAIKYTLSNTPGRPAGWNNIEHVIVIVLENQPASAALAQPFMKSLLTKGAYTSEFYAITHPSQPNYFAMTAGSTFGANNDNVNLETTHIGTLLNQKGKTWKQYAENYPGNCYAGTTSGKYARRHAPFISYNNVRNNPDQCKNLVSGTQFFQDVSNNALPTFSFYVPNNDNNGHDTGVAFADNWLKNTFGPLFNNSALLAHTLFIVTFDEDDGDEGNHIYTVFIGAGVKTGATSAKGYTLYSLLRTIESIFELGTLGRNDQSATDILDIWT